VLALVGGRDPAKFPFNRATRSRRQPGSAFKPLLFAAALEEGFSPVTLLEGLDAISPQGPDEWAPENASGQTSPSLTLRAALIESNNRAATLLQQRVGTRRVMRIASDAGLRDLPNVPSLSLGTGLVTPLELTTAFAMFPNGGRAIRPRGILRILDDDRSVAFTNPVVRENVIAPEVAYQMVSMLQDVVDRGTASQARRMGVRFAAGGKTGTTDDFKDAWFVGFTSSMVVGVWVGFDQPATIGRDAYGSRYALPIWADFMRRAARVRPPGTFDRPSGLQEETLCRISYKRPVAGCPVYTEYLKRGDAVPDQMCPIHRGSLRQRVTRTIQGWTAELARKLRGLFR
jgi:penicillin-binding protein 1A